MAKNKVKVDVEVTDNGTLKQVGGKAAKAAKQLDGVAEGSRNADRRLKGAAKASSNSTKNFSKMAQGISGGLVPAYATLAANVFALSAAFNFLTNAANYKNLLSAQNAYAASTGTVLSSISTQLQKASQGYLNYGQAAEAAAVGAAKGFSTGQLTKLTDDAVKISAALGRSYEDTFNRLLRGVSKAEPELLDELGITLRLETATKRFAAANNKAAKSLTEYERGQAVLAEVNRQIDNMFGQLDSSDFKNPFEELSVTFDEIVKKATQFVLPLFEGLANIINRSAYAAIAIFGMLGVSIFKAAIPTKEMGEAVDGVAERYEKMAKRASESLAKVREEQSKSISALDASRTKASERGQKQASGFVERGSSSAILAKISKDPSAMNRADQANLKKALKAAEAQYLTHGKIVTGIFAGEEIKRVRAFKKTLAEMTASHSTFGIKFISLTKKLVLYGKKAWASSGKAFAVTMKGMASTASKVGSIMNKALGVLGIIGTITILIQSFQELKRGIFDITVSMLGYVDRFIQSGPGKAISKVLVFIQRTLATVLDWTVGLLTDFLRVVSEKIGKALRFMGFEGAAEAIERVAVLDQGMDAVVASMRSMSNAIEEAANGGSSLVEQFKDSTMGKAAQQIQEGALAADELAAKFNDAQQSSERLNTSLASMIENYKKLGERTEFQEAMTGARSVSTAGISSIGIAALNTTDPENQAVLISGLREALGYASQLPGLMGEVGRKWQNADFSTPVGLAAFIGDMMNFERAGAEGVANFEGFRNSLDILGANPQERFKDISGVDTLLANLRVTEEAMRVSAGSLGIGIQELNEEFKDATGFALEDLKTQLTSIAAAYAEIKAEETALSVQRINTATLSGDFVKVAQDEITLREKLLELKTIDLTLEQRALELAAGVGPDRVAEIAREIEAIAARKAILFTEIDATKNGMDDIKQMGINLGSTLQNSMTSAFSSLIQGTKSAKQAFADLAMSMLKNLADITSKMLMMKLLESALGGTSLGGFLGIPSNRYGGVVSQGKQMPGYATGGIASGSQAGYPAMLHGTEAVVPLPNGKSIPVEMKGSSQNNNVTVNVSVDNQGNASTNSQQDSAQAGNLGQVIARAVQQELQNQKRSGGILSPYGAA